jgi:hypothetical protein
MRRRAVTELLAMAPDWVELLHARYGLLRARRSLYPPEPAVYSLDSPPPDRLPCDR